MLKKAAVLFLFGAMICLMLVTGTACTGAPPEAGGAPEAGDPASTYIIGDEQGDWGYPSPFAAYPRGPGFLRVSYVFDTLVWKDSEGFTSALAEEWVFDEEENSYTFQLREGVKWHDDTPFSARDVVFTVEYLKEHPLPWFSLDIIQEVTETEDGEVKIYLQEPYAPFINNVAGVMPILPEHVWADVSDPGEFIEPEAVIGTGPYQLEEYQREQGRYKFTAFPGYYLGEPKVETLLMVKVSEPHLALQRGDVNYAMVQAEAVETLEEAGFQVVEGTHDWNLKLMFNHREEPFNQVSVRRAFAQALNLEELVDRALRGHGLPGSPGLVSPDSRWYAGSDALPDYAHDPDAAIDILEEAGYDFQKELELLVLADYSREAELLAGQLREAGLKVRTRAAESSVVDSRVREWKFDLAVTGHGGVGGDPEVLNRFMVGQGSPHLNARYEHAELEELLRAQGREMDEAKRKELVHDLQRIYAEEIPAYTLHHPTWYYAYDDQVDWFFTHDGIGTGTPLPLNKLALLEGS